MAELSQRLSANAPGAYYIDSTCIDCDLCRQIAPELFARDDESGATVVIRQPESGAEEELARHAADECPMSCIGSDGEEA